MSSFCKSSFSLNQCIHSRNRADCIPQNSCSQKKRLEIVQRNMRETFQSITNWLAGIDVVMFDQVNLDSIHVSFSFFMQSYNAKLIPIRTEWLMDFISFPRRICHSAWLMHGAHRSDICFTTETRCVIARYNKWEAIQLMRSSRALSCVCFAKIDICRVGKQ